jgi:hypothetical protein
MPVINAQVDLPLIEEICELDDEIYRNQWITYVYGEISHRLAARTGGNANWFTFARWSSYTVGENLRPGPTKAFGEFVRGHPLLRMVRTPLIRLQHDLRMMGDASMPRTLALGNRLVFHEIAYQMVEFLDWYESGATPTTAQWRDYRRQIVCTPASDLFPSCDAEWLRGGIEAYFRAMQEPDPDEQARLVLRGTVMLAAYEQWRLEPIVQIAIDPFATYLVKFEHTNMHLDQDEPQAVLRRKGTPWALRHSSPIVEWMCDAYGTLLTSNVMAWEGPVRGNHQSLFLGRALPDPPPGERLVPERLDDTLHPDTLKIVSVFDQSGGTREGRRSHNWSRYNDRMNFIVNLFRAEQDDDGLFTPLPLREQRFLDLNLSDGYLDHLRLIGDEPVDRQVAAHHARSAYRSPRELVHELVADKFPNTQSLYGSTDLPDWASPDLLRLGQQFLCEHGLEIASALFYSSLPYSYTAARGARVLTYTAELTGGRTTRRLAETGQMLLDLMAVDDTCDPLSDGTPGSHAARGVRLFHGAVRFMIMKDPDARWDKGGLGVPINQEDLLGTLIVFTVVAVDALEKLGVDFDTKENQDAREAYIHYWLVVGHLLGIRYDLLRGDLLGPADAPLNLEELRLLQTTIFRRQSEAGPDGQTLMASLLEATKSTMPRFMKGYPAAATRGLLGRERADALAVPAAGPARMVFELMRAGTRLFSPRLPGHGLAALARVSTRTLYRRWIDEHDGAFPQWRLDAVPNWKLRRTGTSDAPKPGPVGTMNGHGPVDPGSPRVVDLVASESEEGGPMPDRGGPDRVDQPS